ncbi:MAG: hypothetical protein GF341_02260 [candidate division Zixibacteria bacterium]|nr:hypothetical protein [candidate division Zixibacteria bacterium]
MRIRQTIYVFVLVTLLAVASYSVADEGLRANTETATKRTTARTFTASLPKATAQPGNDTRAGSALTGISMSWSVSPGGGFAGGSSSQYGLSAAVGQPVVGEGSDVQYGLDIGFYHGVETCRCDKVADLNEDDLYDAVDLNLMIAALFFNGENPQDPTCPTPRSDVNCDSVSDTVDLNLLIAFLFFNGTPPCNACTGQPL